MGDNFSVPHTCQLKSAKILIIPEDNMSAGRGQEFHFDVPCLLHLLLFPNPPPTFRHMRAQEGK